jgi:signal peptidase II
MRRASLILVATVAVDQATKWVVVQGMGLNERMFIEVLPPYLNFSMAWNRGVNFGLLANDAATTRWLLIGVAIAISVWVWLWARREAQSQIMQISAGFLVGGAIGNIIDRLIYGAVADFLNMSCCGFQNPFAFNVADVAIFAGAGLLILGSGRHKTP